MIKIEIICLFWKRHKKDKAVETGSWIHDIFVAGSSRNAEALVTSVLNLTFRNFNLHTLKDYPIEK